MIRQSRLLKRGAVLALGLAWAVCTALPGGEPGPAAARGLAGSVLKETGVQGGLIVHLGCGDGRLTAALRAGEAYLVHGLDTDAIQVEKARRHIRSLGLYGSVSVDRWHGKRLPYVDNLVNLLVWDQPLGVPMDEVMRVLCPGGVALISGIRGRGSGVRGRGRGPTSGDRGRGRDGSDRRRRLDQNRQALAGGD